MKIYPRPTALLQRKLAKIKKMELDLMHRVDISYRVGEKIEEQLQKLRDQLK